MEYIIHIAIMVLLYGMLAMSLNLIVGYTGLLSLAHAAFMGIGAYATAILTTQYNVPFFLSILVGVGLTIIVSFLIGLLLSRFRDDFFALVSLGFMVIIHSFFLNWQPLTNGPLGITNIIRPPFIDLTSSNLTFLVFLLILFVVVYGVCTYIVRSPFGTTLRAIREDERAIQVFGYNTLHYKLLIFIIGAVIASIVGAFFASYITYIDPTSFTISETIFILAIVILGGLASLKGSLVGALILVVLPEALRFLGFPNEIAGQMRQLTYGLLLVILMLYKPQGLLGEYKL